MSVGRGGAIATLLAEVMFVTDAQTVVRLFDSRSVTAAEVVLQIAQQQPADAARERSV